MTQKFKIYMVVFFVFFLFFGKMCFAQNTASELFDLGQTAENQGDKAKAIDFYEKSIESDADFAPAYSALATIYLDQNENMDDVVWLFSQAADLEPQNATHYTNMCRAYFQFQKHDWAEAACLKALSIDPNAMGAKMTLAWVYLFGKAQPADAVKYFKQIIEKVPNPKFYYGLGLAYAGSNEQANALDIITTLRSMGEETLASQLEKMMRTSSGSVAAMPTAMTNVNIRPSQIVSDKPLLPVSPPSSDPQSAGKIRIQLKARLPSPSEVADTQKSKHNPEDDGYDLEDYKPLTLKERQDRVKRMRGNAGKARGQGTVSTQTQSAPQ